MAIDRRVRRNYQVSDMTVRRRIKTGKLHAILQDGKYFIPCAGPEGRLPAGTSHAEPREAAVKPQPAQPSLPRHASQHLAYQQPAPRPTVHDIGVHKSHPQVHANFQPTKLQPPRAATNFDESDGVIPASLRRAATAEAHSLVESRALLAFCEGALRKVAEGERRTIEKFKGKLEALEATLAQRDLEIKTLRQQAEDLQLLVKILEKRK